MTIEYEYTTHVQFCTAVGRHNILLRCLPAREGFQQIVSETFLLSGSPASEADDHFWHLESVDGLGNRIVSGGTQEDHDCLHYSSHGIVRQSVYCIPDTAPHPMYRLPSELTTTTEQITTAQLGTQPAKAPADDKGEEDFLPAILRIMTLVHNYLEYSPGTTDCNTRLDTVMAQRKGVCQDFAHLMIALCRQAGYPARYVCGLMEGEGQTHAWVEVHDGQCWYAFDPTNNTAIATGYIKLAHGRDALDCPVSRGTFLGCAAETTSVIVKVRKHDKDNS